MSAVGNVIDLTREVRAELRADIAQRRRLTRECPVCSEPFTIAADVTPWVTDTCGESSCWMALQRFMVEHPELSNSECVEAIRNEQ